MKRLLLLLLLAICALCAGVYNFFPSTSLTWGTIAFALPQLPHPEEATVQEKGKVLFVGDVMLARSVETVMDTYGADYPFAELPPLGSDSYLVGNFESSVPVRHAQTPSMGFSFSVEQQYLQGLTHYGFTHLGLANNHSYDFGRDDFEHTVGALRDASTTVFGNPRDLASSSIPLLKVGDATIALIGLYAVDRIPTQQEIKSVLSRASQMSTYQVVFIHWGTEYKIVHNETQEKLAHTLIDNGADVIIGHHPHVVQDIEEYKNGIIFYSLGNFVFDQFFSDDVQKGLSVEMSLADDEVLNFKLIPVTSIGSRSVPRHMALFEKDAFLSELGLRSAANLRLMINAGEILLHAQH